MSKNVGVVDYDEAFVICNRGNRQVKMC